MNKYGKWRGRVMELTSFGPRSNVAKDVLYHWLVDDGNAVCAFLTATLFVMYY